MSVTSKLTRFFRFIVCIGEYKYQIGCQVDYDPNNPETPMFIMELERVVRNLPQTITGETPKAMPTRTQVCVVEFHFHYVRTYGERPVPQLQLTPVGTVNSVGYTPAPEILFLSTLWTKSNSRRSRGLFLRAFARVNRYYRS